jgi:DNA repair protein RecO (recombination protein O)
MKNDFILNAVIIKRVNFGEADRIITFYSLEKGKVKALAKGARKIKSKLGGHLELFQPIQVIIHPGRSLNQIIGVNPIYQAVDFANNLDWIGLTYTMAEVVEAFCKEEMPNEFVYNHIVDFLICLKKAKQPQNILEAFKIKLLTALGYLPEFQNCISCKKKFEVNQTVYFWHENNGFVCSPCRFKSNFQENSLLPLSFNTLKVFNYSQLASLANIAPLSLGKNEFGLLSKINEMLIAKYLDCGLRSAVTKIV